MMILILLDWAQNFATDSHPIDGACGKDRMRDGFSEQYKESKQHKRENNEGA
jgi:hypothetical protein